MYNFPFAVDGPYSDGDVPTWNDTTKRWEAQPGGRSGSQTWAETLAEGNVSGANSPIIENEETLGFSDNESEVIVTLGLAEEDETPLFLFRNSDINRELRVEGTGGVSIVSSDTTDTASDVIIRGGDSENATPGHITIQAGSANSPAQGGGLIHITAGDGGGGEVGNGGSVNVTPGSPDGVINLCHENNAVGIVVSGAPSSHTGGQAILVGENGLAFFNGTPVTQPTITGAHGSNAALQSLITALASMGLIIDGTT